MALRTNVALVGLVVLVVLAGCSGGAPGGAGGDAAPQDAAANGGDGGGGGDGGDGGDGGGDAEATAAPARDGGDGGAAEQAFQARSRAIIRTGTVSLQVRDFDSARRTLERTVRQRGGWVAASSETNHSRDNRTWTTGRLVLRVPSEEFSATMDRIKAAGTVESAETNSEDVTDRLVDMEARLKNLRAQRERLRTLYRQANDTEDVLRVEERLSEVQAEIERLEAQKRSLEERVAYSTITVELHEPRPEATPTPTTTPAPGYHETALGSAFLSSIQGVWVALRALAVTVAYVLPYALVFGLPIAGLVYAATRRRELW